MLSVLQRVALASQAQTPSNLLQAEIDFLVGIDQIVSGMALDKCPTRKGIPRPLPLCFFCRSSSKSPDGGRQLRKIGEAKEEILASRERA